MNDIRGHPEMLKQSEQMKETREESNWNKYFQSNWSLNSPSIFIVNCLLVGCGCTKCRYHRHAAAHMRQSTSIQRRHRFQWRRQKNAFTELKLYSINPITIGNNVNFSQGNKRQRWLDQHESIKMNHRCLRNGTVVNNNILSTCM